MANGIDGTNLKKCPYCLSEIPAEAKKCRHCGEWIEESIREGGFALDRFKSTMSPKNKEVNEIIFHENNVTINSRQIIIEGTAYSVNAITAVNYKESTRAKLAYGIASIIIGLFTFGAGFGGLFYVIFFMKNPFGVYVSMASGKNNVRIYVNKDKETIVKITNAINKAINAI